MEPRGSRSKKQWIRWNKLKNWREWTWKGWTLFGVSVLLVIILGYAVYQGVGIYNALDKFEKSDQESRFKDVADKTVQKPPEWAGKERVNILLLGGDARGVQEGQVARSDSMLVVSVDPVTKRAHLLSILRDTYTDIPGHSRNRINTAITLGGPNLAMKTISDLLGIQIHYYVYADFEGFKALVDAIGGVDYEVEKDMRYTDNADKNRYDINLKKGFQHLDGDKALQYVRFRHDAMSDFTRTERQRNFMKVVAAKLQSTWNLVRMKEILESVQPHIETNLKVSDMLDLGQLGLKIQMAGSVQVPPMELIGDERVGGAAVLGIRDKDALRQYVQDVLASTAADPEPTIDVKTSARSSSKPRSDANDAPAATAPPAAEETSAANGNGASNAGSTSASGNAGGKSGGKASAGGTKTPKAPTAPAVPESGSPEAPATDGNAANTGNGAASGNGTVDPNAPVDPATPVNPETPEQPVEPGDTNNAGSTDESASASGGKGTAIGNGTSGDAGGGNNGGSANNAGTGNNAGGTDAAGGANNAGGASNAGSSNNSGGGGTNGSTGAGNAGTAGNAGSATTPTPTTPAGNGAEQPAA